MHDDATLVDEVRTMTTRPVVAGDATPTHRRDPVTPLGRWARAVAAASALLVLLGVLVFGVAYAVAGEEATSDTWVGVLSALAVLLSLPASLVAFVMALVAGTRHESWRALRLPLAVLPALLAFVVLGELFWWE